MELHELIYISNAAGAVHVSGIPDPRDLRNRPGYSEFLEKGLAATGSESTGKRLLHEPYARDGK